MLLRDRDCVRASVRACVRARLMHACFVPEPVVRPPTRCRIQLMYEDTFAQGCVCARV